MSVVLLSLPVLRRVSARLYLADDRQVSETDLPRNFQYLPRIRPSRSADSFVSMRLSDLSCAPDWRAVWVAGCRTAGE